MILIAYAFWICVVVLFCFWLAVRGGKSSRARRAWCTALAIALILLPYWDVILGVGTMRKICSGEAGVRSKDKVEFPLSSVMLVSPGQQRSLCLSCYKILAAGLAREAYAHITVLTEAHGLIEQTGIAKYWLASVGDPACAPFERQYSTPQSRRNLWTSARATYDGKSCIASERVPLANADYTLNYPIGLTERRGVVVIEHRRTSLDRVPSFPIATLTHFQQQPWNGRLIGMYQWLPPAPACPSFIRPLTADNFPPELLLELLSDRVQVQEVFK